MDKWLVLAVDRLLSRADFGNGYVARCAIRNYTSNRQSQAIATPTPYTYIHIIDSQQSAHIVDPWLSTRLMATNASKMLYPPIVTLAVANLEI